MADLEQHYAVVTVIGTQVLSRDGSTIEVEAGGFEPMAWFLKQGRRARKADGEPPSKRRKTAQFEDSDVSLASDADSNIPILRLAIDFYFPSRLDAEPPNEKSIIDDVDFDGVSPISVIPKVVDLFEEGFRLTLTPPGTKDAVLLVDTADMRKSTADTLQATVVARMDKNQFGQTSARQTRSTTSNATWSKCTLSQSRGSSYKIVRLEVSSYWRSGISCSRPFTKNRHQYLDYSDLVQLCPDAGREDPSGIEGFAPKEFYDSVHVPSKTIDTTHDFEGLLESELYPFQKRAVHWLLRREGMRCGDGDMSALSEEERKNDYVDFWSAGKDLEGRLCYVNHLEAIIQRDAPVQRTCPSGGLLAEEMGLGKTVEVMALLSLHRRHLPLSRTVFDEYSGTEVRPSKATLIITPNTILKQWQSELARHAPSLKVLHYEGMVMQKHRSEAQLLDELIGDYDVVLATYNTLQKEVHFAADPPDRPLRHATKVARKLSPLVFIQWWRICLDEAQMVESGVTAAARVARRLPRVHSWAVTGTPLRKDIQDLYGILIFLHYQPFSDDIKLWSHLITNRRHLFRRIFGQIALRHTKAQIRGDLDLPPQKRVVVTVPFSAIEEQQYSTLFTQMCEDVGVAMDGAPKDEGWNPQNPATVESMRTWLVRLRQTCLHPEVGGKNRKALGRGQGPLRTVAEVLDVMIENNETALRVEDRGVLASQLLRAHIIGNAADDDHRSEKALEIYLAAVGRSSQLVMDAEQKLAVATQTELEKGGTAIQNDDEGSTSESNPVLGRLRSALRTAIRLQHECAFFAATAYFNIKSNEALTLPDTARFRELEEKEVNMYETAKHWRREYLRDTAKSSSTLMSKIEGLVKNNALTIMPRIKDLADSGGIQNRKLIEKSDVLFDIVRQQAKIIEGWRSKMAEYLLKALVDDDEGAETTGEEYEESTKLQDELYVYFDAIKAMQADLNTCITGESAPLIDHEVQYSIRAAKSYLDPETPEEMKAFVHAPELTLELLAMRNKLRAKMKASGSVRELIQQARGIETSLDWQGGSIRMVELSMVQKHVVALQAVFTSYTTTLSGLEKEVDLFRDTQNQRLAFYRQLQELSDAVKPYKEELDPTLDIAYLEDVLDREEKQSQNLAKLQTTNRFLLHLRDDDLKDERICVICREPFEIGVLTVCGHQYCKDCIKHWWSAHKTCPICKRGLSFIDFHNITYKPQQFKAQEEVDSEVSSPLDNASSPSSRNSSIYSDMDSQLMDKIKCIDLPTSYGTKIDTLGRHLHWIRQNDPGAKSIVFSQYREFLDVLGKALSTFKIGVARLGRAGAVEKFKHNASIDCLLLDAKTDSSGLTLVNATHVFICEPLIQTAVELQAIARVHRIGQTRPTTVWMYLINDTVEKAVYETSVARRLAHVQNRQQQQQAKDIAKSRSATPAPGLAAGAVEAVESEEMQSKPLSKLLVAGKSGGEIVDKEDLWRCLFGKASKASSQSSEMAERVVGRHLRAEAAEGRMQLEQD